MSSSDLRIATLVDAETDLTDRLRAAELTGAPLLAATNRSLRAGFVDAIDARGLSRAEARNRVLDAASGWVLWLEAGERLAPEAGELLRAWLAKGDAPGGPGEAVAAPVILHDPTGLPQTALRLMRACPEARFGGDDSEGPEIEGPVHPHPIISVERPVQPFAGFDHAERLFSAEDPDARRQALEELRELVSGGPGEIRIQALCALMRYALHQGELDQALELGFHGLRIDPRFAEVPCLLGDIYRARLEWEKALLWYKHARILRRPTWARHSDPLKYGWEPRAGIALCNRKLPLERRDPPVFLQRAPRRPRRATVLIATCGPLAPSVLASFEAQTWEERELIVVDDGLEPDLRLKNSRDGRITYIFAAGAGLSLGRKLELARERVAGGRIFVWEPRAAYAPTYLEELWGKLDETPLLYATGFWVLRQEDGRCGFLRPSKKHDDRAWFGTGLCCNHRVFQQLAFRDSDRDALLFFVEDGEARGYWADPIVDSAGLCVAELGFGDLAGGLADFSEDAPEEVSARARQILGA